MADRAKSRRRSPIRDAARSAARTEVPVVPVPEVPVPPSEDALPDPLFPAREPASAADDAGRVVADLLEALVPVEAQLHFLNAGREIAAGVQVTIEHHLARTATPPAEKSVRIEIE